jgi:diaminopimelate epimerase
MCGNGVRATAALIKFLGKWDTNSSTIVIETRAGLKVVQVITEQLETAFSAAVGGDNQKKVDVYRVNMGAWTAENTEQFEVQVNGVGHRARFVDMGNEHLVVELDFKADLERLDLTNAPVVVAKESNFAERVLNNGTNVEFYYAHYDELAMRVYERGVGETLSCGTGVCATAIAHFLDKGSKTSNVVVKGGRLEVDVREDFVSLQGSAQIVGEFKYV